MLNEKMSLRQLQEYFAEAFKTRGFTEETMEDKLLLLMEEVGELAKALRKKRNMGIDYQRIENYDSVESEAADVTIVLIALCNAGGIDLYQAIEAKEKVNAKRNWEKRGV